MKNLIVILTLTMLEVHAQEFAIKQLENSPRHHEWVMVPATNRDIKCFVVYPEISEKAPVVIVIHENMGLTPWVRSFADQLAEKGFIAVAPDLLSDFDNQHESTSSFVSTDEARNAIYKLDRSQVMADLEKVTGYASEIPAGNRQIAVAGFCWGGMQSFNFATFSKNIKAALVFYGSAPENAEDIRKISAPVYAFYAGNDERINSGISEADKKMKAEGKTYDYVIYPGAGHGFMRQGDYPGGSAENVKARNEAWDRMLSILGEFK